jgi:hypothetical protein
MVRVLLYHQGVANVGSQVGSVWQCSSSFQHSSHFWTAGTQMFDWSQFLCLQSWLNVVSEGVAVMLQ